MTRLAWLMMLALFAVACRTKPTEEDCRKAITNMQTLLGTDKLQDTELVESQVRRCKGGSSKKSVQCAIGAKSLDELSKCDFYKTAGAEPAAAPGTTPGSAAPGSAAPGSAAPGSAAPGSAAPGSETAGSAPGSAAPGAPAPDPGAPGSAAPPAAPGSAAAPGGSAAPAPSPG